MTLDLSALRRASEALHKSYGFMKSDLARDVALYEQFRAASIQAFEFTYEVAFKMLKRRLELTVTSSEIDQMTYMQVIRSAAEAGLITDVARFRDYREKRNITSQSYNSEKAETIVSILAAFTEDIRFLLSQLQSTTPRAAPSA
jgi:nucleotidyltransferase substrate binding protein (TIGR01987 family)